MRQQLAAHHDAGHSVVVVGGEDVVHGLIALADAPRPGARQAIAALHRLGIRHVAMLTGDNHATARAIADELDKLPWLVGHARATLNIIRQNIVLSLAIKLLFVGLTLLGAATLWMAIAADMGTSLAVIFNSLRWLRGREKDLRARDTAPMRPAPAEAATPLALAESQRGTCCSSCRADGQDRKGQERKHRQASHPYIHDD